MTWRKAGKAAGGALLDGVREWIAIIGGLGGGLERWAVDLAGRGRQRAGVVCLVLAVAALVAAFFGMRDRDAGGWAGAMIAIVLGVAAFVAFGLATGT